MRLCLSFSINLATRSVDNVGTVKIVSKRTGTTSVQISRKNAFYVSSTWQQNKKRISQTGTRLFVEYFFSFMTNSFMVFAACLNGLRPIKLLQNHHPRQMVGKGHGTHGQTEIRLVLDSLGNAEG